MNNDFIDAVAVYAEWIGYGNTAPGTTSADLQRHAKSLSMNTSYAGSLYRGLVVPLDKLAGLLSSKKFTVKHRGRRPAESWTKSLHVATNFAKGLSDAPSAKSIGSTTEVGVVLKEKNLKTVAVIDQDAKDTIMYELDRRNEKLDDLAGDPNVRANLFLEEKEVVVESSGTRRFDLCRSVVRVVIATEFAAKRAGLFNGLVVPKLKGDSKKRIDADNVKNKTRQFMIFGCDNRGGLTYNGLVGLRGTGKN